MSRSVGDRLTAFRRTVSGFERGSQKDVASLLVRAGLDLWCIRPVGELHNLSEELSVFLRKQAYTTFSDGLICAAFVRFIHVSLVTFLRLLLAVK